MEYGEICDETVCDADKCCHFRLVLEKQEKFDGHQQFFAIVQLIGTRKQAENFAYRSVFKQVEVELSKARARKPSPGD